MRELRSTIAAHIDDRRCGERIREGVRLAIVGAPDVGKSSLMNLLCGRQAAIVAAGAGTTRDVVSVQADVGGFAVQLSDTAGIRYGKDVSEVEREVSAAQGGGDIRCHTQPLASSSHNSSFGSA